MSLRKPLMLTIMLAVAVLLVGMGEKLPIQPFCPFHKLTGIPCPGCGGVRSERYLLSGHLLLALYTNPLSVLLCCAIPVCVMGLWVDLICGTNKVESFLKRKWNITSTVLLFMAIILNWVWNIQKGL